MEERKRMCVPWKGSWVVMMTWEETLFFILGFVYALNLKINKNNYYYF